MVWKNHPIKSFEGVSPQFQRDAHRLSDADEFLPHFLAVTQLPGVSTPEAAAACNWEDPSKVNFQYGDQEEWVKEARPVEEIDSRRKQWQDFVIGQMFPWDINKHNVSGRGAAVLSGNENSFWRTKVMLGQLARLGSKLPVEIHYWKKELNDTSKGVLREIYPNLYFNDLSGKHNVIPTNNDNTFFVNYQMKPAAIINSRFEEVLFMDSDNVPAIDPMLLFDSQVFREYGSVFWPDIARTRPQNPMWSITNTPCKMNEYENESGQLMVNKKKFFYHLQLAAWYNNIQGEYYNGFLLGDKDLFRFAWHALKTEYGRPSRWVTSVGTNVPSDPNDPKSEHYYCGHTFAQHHPDTNGSIAFYHGGLLKQIAPETLKWHIAERGGIYQTYKRIHNDEDPFAFTNVGIKFDGGGYLPQRWRPEKGKDLKMGFCTDYYDVQPRPLEELDPEFQYAFRILRGYWIVGF
ncbi:glycosyltransferase family 71 protein [Myriangium duriaei CBS 260.36]|uniref:Glycosyltransferase family 71 protein n=1 Tax=Myriangium duriaei CBS 260.36 TaxID=1168546 RepID=A0A9P4JEF2_9PEZI|nr:glycosyltransferase family 71 protein [Myriangium duriaei CBS 260.36]